MFTRCFSVVSEDILDLLGLHFDIFALIWLISFYFWKFTVHPLNVCLLILRLRLFSLIVWLMLPVIVVVSLPLWDRGIIHFGLPFVANDEL